MGYWEETCGLTGIPIFGGDICRRYLFHISNSRIDSTHLHFLKFYSIINIKDGIYNNYGDIEIEEEEHFYLIGEKEPEWSEVSNKEKYTLIFLSEKSIEYINNYEPSSYYKNDIENEFKYIKSSCVKNLFKNEKEFKKEFTFYSKFAKLQYNADIKAINKWCTTHNISNQKIDFPPLFNYGPFFFGPKKALEYIFNDNQIIVWVRFDDWSIRFDDWSTEYYKENKDHTYTEITN